MTAIGKQIANAVTYIVFLGPLGDERRPLWAIITWWLLAFAMFALVSLYLQGNRWGLLWPALLPVQWLVLHVSRPAKRA